MRDADVQYVTNEQGDVTGVLVPIALWREIASELETQHLLASPAMRAHLAAARASTESIPLDEALTQLGIKE